MRYIAIDQEAGTTLTLEGGETHTLQYGDILYEDGAIFRDPGSGEGIYVGQVDVEGAGFDQFDLFDFEDCAEDTKDTDYALRDN